MPIRCRITGINGSALLEMSGVIWERIPQVTPAQRSRSGPFAFFFFSLAFDLREVPDDPLQMAWMRFAAHCLPRYQPLSPCYHPPPTTTTTHTHTRLRANRQGKELARVQQPRVCVSAAGEALPQAAQGWCSATGPNSKECFKWRAQIQ